jgi:cytochrome c556
MKRFVHLLGLLLIGLSIALPASAAKDPKKDAIKARQGEMHLRSFNAGPLFAMAKGKMPYDAEMAKKLANNLKLMLDLDNGRAWMKGTSNKDYPDDTTALPKIWETWPDIADYGKKYAKAVNEVAAVAGNGQDALKGKIKDLGKACKNCHDDFRKKDE